MTTELLTIADLAHDSDLYADSQGFTIGRGKKIYWYISPTKNGMYMCFPIERNGTLGWAKFVKPTQEITVIKTNQT